MIYDKQLFLFPKQEETNPSYNLASQKAYYSKKSFNSLNYPAQTCHVLAGEVNPNKNNKAGFDPSVLV